MQNQLAIVVCHAQWQPLSSSLLSSGCYVIAVAAMGRYHYCSCYSTRYECYLVACSGGLCWTHLNYLKQCWTSFPSIDATPSLSLYHRYGLGPFSYRHKSSAICMFPQHLSIEHDVFCRPTLCTIQHSMSSCRRIKLACVVSSCLIECQMLGTSSFTLLWSYG
jgi:hypothetical protein